VGSILLIQPDTGCFELKAGDIIVACTDGLSDRIDDQLLLEYGLKFAENLEGYADKLLDRALDCGGQDNISLILAQVMS
jgi:serine/threonine protein phosphatase PrpC